jgi:hypothetical protein
LSTLLTSLAGPAGCEHGAEAGHWRGGRSDG